MARRMNSSKPKPKRKGKQVAGLRANGRKIKPKKGRS